MELGGIAGLFCDIMPVFVVESVLVAMRFIVTFCYIVANFN